MHTQLRSCARTPCRKSLLPCAHSLWVGAAPPPVPRWTSRGGCPAPLPVAALAGAAAACWASGRAWEVAAAAAVAAGQQQPAMVVQLAVQAVAAAAVEQVPAVPGTMRVAAIVG